MGRWVLRAVAATGVLVCALTAHAEEAIEPCTLDPGPVRTVVRVLDAETLMLDDGSAVRLIGALAPRARDAGALQGAWPPETDALAALSALVLGKKVKLAFGGRRSDRYGRHLAHLFLQDGARDAWVQGEMLTSGHARVYGLKESFACSRELLAHEAKARRAGLGLWANGVYRPMPANHPAELMKLRGKYERVIGSIASVGRTKSATYLNFGSDWHSDFTARIDKGVLAAHPDFAGMLDGLAAKTVIVRGWIERRNGPMIDVADPSEIEVIEGERQPAVVSERSTGGEAQPAHAPADTEPGAPLPGEPPKNLRPAPPEGAEPGAVNL
jgi:endonuclease YncB( thermonuclease family)